jgi:hypothetical protein
MSAWEQTNTALERKSIALAGVYLHAKLLAWDDAAITLGLAADSLQASLASDADNITKLRAFLREHTGAPLDVKVKAISGLPTASAAGPPAPAARSVAEVDAARTRVDKQAREDEARKHPLTEAVLDTFGAEIKEIKVDG